MIGSERRFSSVVVVVLILAGLSGGAMAYRQILREVRSVAHQKELDVLGQVPFFELMRENQKTLTSDTLLGEVWVADFIFTRCAGPCPRMTAQMAKLQDRLTGFDDLRFVTFTVDPEYDTPEVLDRYAREFGADPDRWFFLTGDRQRIRELSIKGFKLAVGEAADDEHFILHSTRFVLVDRKGRIRGYYDETEPEQMAKLAADVRRVAAQP